MLQPSPPAFGEKAPVRWKQAPASKLKDQGRVKTQPTGRARSRKKSMSQLDTEEDGCWLDLATPCDDPAA
ncbi:hypothetical protein ACRE_041010 [Hapsidospora chrysogenum ATCC 11550]|uniref:Uncharacterized protein n=1 Tax=Hapsidospora chrysogenum (strain ATCC 11550 / CBS 779.69 / DSM 880 / IAM 14645 / JCM 23072 / IMI 49137) TaxID=857340 RepID=A0A086T6W0_HAPC1|nr:hypothetical protein ACRE_041010 [Hapsidospora chrysogenum ATCC 11550]